MRSDGSISLLLGRDKKEVSVRKIDIGPRRSCPLWRGEEDVDKRTRFLV